nr:hypothetical protein [Tanacetum cinerariifolium]
MVLFDNNWLSRSIENEQQKSPVYKAPQVKHSLIAPRGRQLKPINQTYVTIAPGLKNAQASGGVGKREAIKNLSPLGQAGKKIVPGQQYVLLPLLTFDAQRLKCSEDEVADDAGKKRRERAQRNECESIFGQDKDSNGNRVFAPVSAAGSTHVNLGGSIPVNAATLSNADLPTDPLMPDLEDIANLQDTEIFSGSYDDEVKGAVTDFNNLELTTVVSPIPTTRIPKDHPKEQITVRCIPDGYKDCLSVWHNRRGGVCVPIPSFEDPHFSNKVEKTLYGLHQAPKDCQDKYVADILKKFDFPSVKTASTPIETNKALLKDEEAEDVDFYLYRSMIGSLRDSPFDLEAFSDSDYAGASHDRKSIIRGCQFLRKSLISLQCKKQTVVVNSTTEAKYVDAANCCEQKKQKSRRKQRKKIEVPSPSSEIPNEEGVPITSSDPLPSGEDRMQLNKLMILCTNLQKQVLDLEKEKTAQTKEIASLKKRVKKLEQKRKSRTLGLRRLRKVGSARRVEFSTEASLGDQEDASKQGMMIDNIDQNVKITLVDDTQGRINEEDMFGVNDLDGDEVVVDVPTSENVEQSVKVVEKEVSTADPVTTAGEVVTTAGIKVITAATTPKISKYELTLAQTLIEIKAAKPKAITTAATTVTAANTRPKEKGIVIDKAVEGSEKAEEVSSKRAARINSGENEADHIETAKTNFMAQSNRRKFLLEHAWCILKDHSKWDAPKPLDMDDHTEIFGPDVRPRLASKTQPLKKTKSKTTGAAGEVHRGLYWILYLRI